ncbi:TPA: hypothetical protein TZ704_001335 [Streptococcus suis]|nr:hypothetical protein [Streptococcus suis]
MIREDTRFPIISDNEPLIEASPQMLLYEESDLISNIKGPYQDKVFEASGSQEPAVKPVPEQTEDELLPPLFATKRSHYSRRDRNLHRPVQHAERKTQGQLAREVAKEDIKKKRSASYLKDDFIGSKPKKVSTVQPTPRKEATGNLLANLADRLRQESYILADLPEVYSLKKEDRVQEKTSSNQSFDFLKRSQVYNYPERRAFRDKQVAQELNLTQIEED